MTRVRLNTAQPAPPDELEIDFVEGEWPYINFAFQADGRLRIDIDGGTEKTDRVEDRTSGDALAFLSEEDARVLQEFLNGRLNRA